MGELKKHNGRLRDGEGWWINDYHDYYFANEVDAALASKDAAVAELQKLLTAELQRNERLEAERDSLRAELEKIRLRELARPSTENP